MKALQLLFVCLFVTTHLFGQDHDQKVRKGDPVTMIGSTIKGDDISEYLHVLAADDMQGRETGEPGNRKAAEYIASKFKEMGIATVPGYDSHFQELTFTRVKLSKTELSVNEVTYQKMKDFAILPSLMPSDEVEFDTEEIIFMGYGIDDPAYSDYTSAPNLTGATILIYEGEPFDADGNSLISGSTSWSPWATDLEGKLRVAHEKGVRGVMVISSDFKNLVRTQRRFIIRGRTIMGTVENANDLAPHLLISSTLAKSLLGKKSAKVIKARDKITMSLAVV